jgi:ABC-type multidrug transport system ATPase subunit
MASSPFFFHVHRQPRLLICDEATSALDTATERSIMASLQELATGRTSVFVAHRLSTVQGCDRIYVLKDGKVVEQGTHIALMAANGLYREMWAMQEAQGPDTRGSNGEDDGTPSGEQFVGDVQRRAPGNHRQGSSSSIGGEKDHSSGMTNSLSHDSDDLEEFPDVGEVEAAAIERAM